MISFPTDRMPEAEVALRLVFYLLERREAVGHAEVAIDGASAKVDEIVESHESL